jgi:hypothetical protein
MSDPLMFRVKFLGVPGVRFTGTVKHPVYLLISTGIPMSGQMK